MTLRAIAMMAVGACAFAAPASAATITVTGTGDAIAADGSCVLREAITAANTNAASNECAAGQATPTVDTIGFSIPGAGPHVIALGSGLPVVSDSVVIDGDTDANPGPGTDQIRLDNPTAGLFVALDFEADDSEVRDLVMTRLPGSIEAGGTDGMKIEDNIIGTTPAGAAGLGGTTGISGAGITDAEISDNVIASQSSYGIKLDGPGLADVEIMGNLIGTNPAGTAALTNGFGIYAVGTNQDVVIGGTGTDGNVVSANESGAITVQLGAAHTSTGLVITGNRIGTAIGGENAIPNSYGVRLSGPIQGAEIRGNLISGNDDSAIDLAGVAGAPVDGTVIAGNLIGTDKDGLEPLGNTSGAIGLAAFGDFPVTNTTIGGTTGLTPGGACTGDCNVIADNGDTLFGSVIGIGPSDSTGTRILGNHIGTDIAGTGALGNTGRSITVDDGMGAVIGAPGAGNVIADSPTDGILIEGETQDATIQSNLIGVGSDGATPLGNDGFGINVRGSVLRTQIGGLAPAEANQIANSDDMAMRIEDEATDNAVLGNSMYDNGFGIDLFPEPGPQLPTPNDDLDADLGPNDLQNFPSNLVASTVDGTTYVAGELSSSTDNDFRLEFFVADSTIQNYGEGSDFLGATTVSTDAEGSTRFAAELPASAEDGLVTATATRLNPVGDPLSTSEFSENVAEVDCDIEGSPSDDPGIVGTPASEVICGLGGDDVVDGGGGFDFIIGGSGTDEVTYAGAGGEISADLGRGLIEESGGGDTIVVGIENLVGTDLDDTIIGSPLANFVQAGDGKDTIEGGDGDDELKGGIGGDTLKGGDGADELLSQDGGDVLKGQSGSADDLSAGPGKDNLNGGGGTSDHCNGGGNADDTPAPGCESTSSIP